LSYFLAALNVTFRDTQHTLGVVLQLFFYLTPIFYALTNVPTSYQTLYYLNPMVHIVTAYRDILIQGTQPNWQALAMLGAAMAVLLPIGSSYFCRQSDRFVEEL
jgi:lipopolysaccharide transport system permease protein